MNVAVVGTGYVGLVLGTSLANLGNNVRCVDIDKKKIDMLKKGKVPIYEPGLEEMVETNLKSGTLQFSNDVAKAIQDSQIIFLAVGTPPNKYNQADLSAVDAVANTIAENINEYKVIVNKSTVPVGTAYRIKEIISKRYKGEFDVASNPEFMREGKALRDFNIPDRVVIGVESDKARDILYELYKPLERVNQPIMVTDIKSAEIIKYASNSFLATKISFINEVSQLCEAVGADVRQVAKGVGLDKRIGPKFLQAGLGYGGSCFPKDVQAFIQTGKDNHIDFEILNAVESVNKKQRVSIIPKVAELIGDIKDKNIAIWGLAFKPDTDDMREAVSVYIIRRLLGEEANIRAYDPISMENCKKIIKNIYYAKDPYDALKDADILILVTEWNVFKSPDYKRMKELMREYNIVDGRNIYDPQVMKKEGFKYKSVGR